ncbi:MAG: alpha-amylase [Candidatus Lokiarchaeota archaeon]|nr:alpha-amylase [Candidatus Lokiarchaeota archaeon]MBD3200750.1 alpha-amylase [Candidatus Lokiarchaeota archaeon]
MKISREARNKYQLDDFKYSDYGSIDFEGEIYPVRAFVQKLNNKKDLINFPELGFQVGKINGMALLFEINDYLFNLYDEDVDSVSLHEDLYDHLTNKLDEEDLIETTRNLINEFPPEKVYNSEIDVDEYLETERNEVKNKKIIIKELLKLKIANDNPAFSPYRELFDDDKIRMNTIYDEITDEIKDFFKDKPKFGPKDENLIDILQKPIKKHPNSIKDQLEYIHDEYGSILGNFALRILTALDLIREEEMFRGLGPGEARVLDYNALEYENFTPDKFWMPKVVMIAKHTYVWLDQLSKKYNKSITKLHQIPNEELDQLKEWGFNALWLIGIWERSQASKRIKRWCGNPEAEASAYSLYDYVIAYDLGGPDSFENLKRRAIERGIRIASDMVPNHTGIVSKWMMEHPDWYVQLDYKPFPSYEYTGENLSGDSNVGIYLEDKYFTRTDAAVTFKRVNYQNNKTRYIYHGNDGTSFPWNDTAQLNYLNPEVREAVIQTILHVSRLSPIIRFDAAMTLTRKHFQRLWFPEPGTGGAIPSRAENGMSKEEFYKKMPKEFWREVVDRINKENPDTLLIAEAFWLLEGFFVRTLGMHRVYNSAFMNMMSDEDNTKFRAVLKNTLEFDPKILKRFVNFMNNPDEETAIKQFGDGDKYFGVCLMMVTMPGLPMFGHGQIQGFEEKYGMEYRKSYWNEEINWGLVHRHEDQIFPIMKKRYIFADVDNFLLYDFWTGDVVNEDVYAFSNSSNDQRALIVYHNKYAETKGFIKQSVGFAVKDGDGKKIEQRTLAEGLQLPEEGYCIFKDYITELEYIRRNKDIHEKGLYLELRAYETHAFLDFRITQDDEFFHYTQLHDLLNGRGVHNIDQTLTQVIYQPLHAPFEKLVNVNNFEKIVELENIDSYIKTISPDLERFLEEVKNYSSGTNNLKKIKLNILDILRTSLELKNKLKEYDIINDKMSFIEDLLPKNDFDWGIILSWGILHQLGKVVSKNQYKLISRSWIDEWQLSKYINLTLEGLKTKDSQNPARTTTLIKILIMLQDLFINNYNENFQARKILKELFTDSDVRQFIDVNRYKEILWFRAENFITLCNWISLVTIIKDIANESKNIGERISKNLELIRNFRKTAKNVNYRLNEFLEQFQ